MPKDEHQLENDASNSSAFNRRRKDVSEGTVLREVVVVVVVVVTAQLLAGHMTI